MAQLRLVVFAGALCLTLACKQKTQPAPPPSPAPAEPAAETVAATADSDREAAAADGADCEDPNLEVRSEKHPNGQTKKEYQVKITADGTEVMHGYFRSWHANGKPYLEGQHVDGKRDGLWLTWHKTGGRRGEGTLKMGEKHGTWTMWDPEGNEVSRTEWVNGEQQ